MTKLQFYGPFQFIDIDRVSKSAPNEEKAGIYIWGFMYEYNESGLIKLVDFRGPRREKMKFIPFYVGKHQSNIFTRLTEHQSVRKGDATKYTRLSFEYLKRFFMDKFPEDPEDLNFPIHYSWPKYAKIYNQNIANLIEKNKKRFIYFNNNVILASLYPGSEPINVGNATRGNYKITEQTFIEETKDTLNVIVNMMNNFWFCYALANVSKKKLYDCEAYTFFSLKGKTIGQTKNCPKPDMPIMIIDKTDSSIFKISKSDMTIKPSGDFTEGY